MAPMDKDQAATDALRAAAKQALRQRMRRLRQVMPEAACAARSHEICARLLELPEFSRSQCIVSYRAFQKEADPAEVLESAERAGKTVGLVRIEPAMSLALHRHRSGEPLVANAFGLLEPPADAPPIASDEVDLIIVPALAVDDRGQRIGYGRGYYDRLLPRLGRAFKIAVAYDFQLLVETPDSPRDVAVDCVVTDRRVLRTSTR
jgi:5-formyltetrahydrofolate cyclo-ligase